MAGAYDVVKQFEKEIADYCGSPYGVSVSSASNAFFLLFKYLKVGEVEVPCRTYPGVPMAVLNSGGSVYFKRFGWFGGYQLLPLKVFDYCLRFEQDLTPCRNVRGLCYYILSFHSKKPLPIGRGGMILTNDDKAVEYIKRARFDGRNECSLFENDIKEIGWNMYLTPEQAARGLTLFEHAKGKTYFVGSSEDYPDLSKMEVFRDNSKCRR